MKTKIQRVYQDHGFGFPVFLLNVPMMEFHGDWVAMVNQKKLIERVVKILALKESRLTGNETRFLRHYIGMTLSEFAERFNVTHPAVMKWERAGSRRTSMTWATEKDIRLLLLTKLEASPNQFMKAYRSFAKEAERANEPLKIDLKKKSA